MNQKVKKIFSHHVSHPPDPENPAVFRFGASALETCQDQTQTVGWSPSHQQKMATAGLKELDTLETFDCGQLPGGMRAIASCCLYLALLV